jgi:hypothetical protein
MARRRFLVAVAIGAGAVLLIFRPGGDDPQPAGSGQPEQPAPPAAGAPLAPVPPAAATSSRPAVPVPTVIVTSPPAPEPPHDHSGITEEETLPAAAAGEAVAAAERFAVSWSNPAPDWQARLADLTTPALAESLAGADPPQPTPEITGAGQLLFEAPAWARVGVPARRGTLVLDLVVVEGHWLVSAIDWWPA